MTMAKNLYIDGGYHKGEGYRSMRRRKIIGEGWKLKGFEPNPFLEIPAWVTRAALSHVAGRVPFYPQGALADGDGSSIIPQFANALDSLMTEQARWKGRFNPSKTAMVKTVRLPPLLEAWAKDQDRVVVKLDIEGMEYDVLEDVLASGTAHLIHDLHVEFHDWLPGWNKTPEHTKDLKARLQAAGVRVHYHG